MIKTTASVLILLILARFAWEVSQHVPEFLQWIDQLGWIAPVFFILTYCFATILLFPTMVLTLAGGAIFGPIFGTILNLIGATAGAAIAFLITRYFLYDWFKEKKGKKLNQLIAGVDQRGWLFVALLRLFPIIPFNLVNYGMGITEIKFRLYLLITFIFLIPAEIIYTYFGYAGMGALSHSPPFYKKFWLLSGGAALIILLIYRHLKHRKIIIPCEKQKPPTD